MAACVLARVLRVLRVRALVLVRVLRVRRVLRVLLCALVVVRVRRHARVRVLGASCACAWGVTQVDLVRVLRARVRRHVLRSWFPPTPGNPGTPPAPPRRADGRASDTC